MNCGNYYRHQLTESERLQFTGSDTGYLVETYEQFEQTCVSLFPPYQHKSSGQRNLSTRSVRVEAWRRERTLFRKIP